MEHELATGGSVVGYRDQGFPNLGFWGVPIVRTMAFGGSYWSPPYKW